MQQYAAYRDNVDYAGQRDGAKHKRQLIKVWAQTEVIET